MQYPVHFDEDLQLDGNSPFVDHNNSVPGDGGEISRQNSAKIGALTTVAVLRVSTPGSPPGPDLWTQSPNADSAAPDEAHKEWGRTRHIAGPDRRGRSAPHRATVTPAATSQGQRGRPRDTSSCGAWPLNGTGDGGGGGGTLTRTGASQIDVPVRSRRARRARGANPRELHDASYHGAGYPTALGGGGCRTCFKWWGPPPCPTGPEGGGVRGRDASKRGEPPPPSRAPSPCPATVSLTPSAGFNGICNRQ